jgi:hypothetical protein
MIDDWLPRSFENENDGGAESDWLSWEPCMPLFDSPLPETRLNEQTNKQMILNDSSLRTDRCELNINASLLDSPCLELHKKEGLNWLTDIHLSEHGSRSNGRTEYLIKNLILECSLQYSIWTFGQAKVTYVQIHKYVAWYLTFNQTKHFNLTISSLPQHALALLSCHSNSNWTLCNCNAKLGDVGDRDACAIMF